MDLTLSLDDLVDRAILGLMAPAEQGAPVVVTADAGSYIELDEDGSFFLPSPSDLVEVGGELMLVTGVDGTTSPSQFAVSRNFYQSPNREGTLPLAGLVNPQFPRVRIREAVRRSFARLEAMGVPLVTTEQVTIVGETAAELPEGTRTVFDVFVLEATSGRLKRVTGWEWFDDVGALSSTGNLLNLPRCSREGDELWVQLRKPYRWSSHPAKPDGDDTIEVPEGCEDLPAMYATAWLMSSREVSRAEMDVSDEWARTEQYQRGVVSGIVRSKWQEFYRALDEARRLNEIPQRIIHRGVVRS